MRQSVLVAIDASEQSFNAAALAARLLSHGEDHHVLLVHCLSVKLDFAVQKVVDTALVDWHQIDQWRTQNAQELLNRARALFEAEGIDLNRIELVVEGNCESAARSIVRRAEKVDCRSIFLGRRGLSPMKRLLLGSTSDKVSQYARGRTVWVVDRDVRRIEKVLVAIDHRLESEQIIEYVGRFLGPLPGVTYTFLHIMPRMPPALWDDGRILEAQEREERSRLVKKWHDECRDKVEGYFSKARTLLLKMGVPDERIRTRAHPTQEGIARDIVKRIRQEKIDIIVIGKKSLGKGKPFFMGSHANKILHHGADAAICLVDRGTDE